MIQQDKLTRFERAIVVADFLPVQSCVPDVQKYPATQLSHLPVDAVHDEHVVEHAEHQHTFLT